MTVTYRVDLGASGVLTLETSAKDLVAFHGDPAGRRDFEGCLHRMVLVLLGSARSRDAANALMDLDQLILDFARRRMTLVRKLNSN